MDAEELARPVPFSRRLFLTASAGTLVSAMTSTHAPNPQRPNIIIILTDDQGYHDLGCQGSSDLKTPHIDALALSGLRFTNWYANAPMCAPSRAALLTGRYPIRAGVPANSGKGLPPTERTLAAMLHGEGYATGLVGKWHLGSRPGSPNAHGFDQFFGFLDGCVDYYSHRFYWGEPRVVNYHDLWRNSEEVFEDGSYLTEVFTREAKQFIKASQARPFFLYLAYNAPHYPMHAPRRYLERFPGLAPERQVYAAMLAAVDDGVGEIRQLLRQLGIERHTIVFFASDNGATRERRAGLQGRPATAGQNTPCRGYKFSLFDGGLRVPAILSWPGQLPQAQVSGQVGSHIDLMPTILRAVGVAPPTDRKLDGIDLFPALQQGSLVERPPLYWASQGQLAVRRGAWKLVIRGFEADGTPAGSKPLAGDDELFLSNLEEDAGESRNQRYVQRDLCQALEKEARAWWKELESTSESSA